MSGINIWAVNDGEKVYKNDFRNSNKYGNSVWDGQTVRLFSGKNETVAFQIVFENGGFEQNRIDIKLKNLEQFKIEVFKEHYLYIAKNRISPPAWFYAEGGRPTNWGWTPDALIPVDVCGGININPDETQGFWFDLYIPRDTPHGQYGGEIEISSSNNGFIASLPIKINIKNITLDDDFRRKNMIYVGGVKDYYPNNSESIRDEFRKMARAHGFDIVGSQAHSKMFDREFLDGYYDKYMRDGDNLFTPKYGYDSWGMGRGERIFPIGMYGGPILGEGEEQTTAEAQKWENWFKEKSWKGMYYWYICDEPKENQYAAVREKSGWLKKRGITLPVFTTSWFKPELEGYIDHWSSGHGVNIKDRNSRPEDNFSFYNGYSPAAPMVNIDGSALEFRVNQWLKERYDVDLYFYWEGTHWQHNHSGPRRHTHLNIWQDPITFIIQGDPALEKDDPRNRDLNFVNGDGTFFYPGNDPYFPENSLYYDGPIGCIRMKNLRRGAQDATYIQMAKDIGLADKADKIIKEAVPVGMSEANLSQPPSWSLRGNDWDKYRLEIMDLFEFNY